MQTIDQISDDHLKWCEQSGINSELIFVFRLLGLTKLMSAHLVADNKTKCNVCDFIKEAPDVLEEVIKEKWPSEYKLFLDNVVGLAPKGFIWALFKDPTN